MKETTLIEELEREREKLGNMVAEAIKNDKSILKNDEILKQSQRKVDALLNKVQKQKDRKEKSRGDSR